MGGWLNPSILLIMIRNLITATLVASLPILNATNGTHRANTLIDTLGTPISQVVEGEQAEYYYLKVASNISPATGTNVRLKGYQYTKAEYQNAEDGWYTTQIIDYYIKTDNTATGIENIKYSFIGTWYNNGLDANIYEYQIGQITNQNDIDKIESFYTNTPTYESLTSLRQIGVSTLQYTDAGQDYLIMDFAQVYQYLRVRLYVEFYIQDIAVADCVLTTRDIYRQITVEETIFNGVPPTNYEVIDIPGIMFEILGMPFAWMSIAFNLTLFPGTPYAINISRLFFAILGSLILLIILKRILK